MQTSAPPGKPAPTHTQLDDATNLNTAFDAHFAAEEPVKEVAPAPEPAPVPVVESPAPTYVDEPVIIPEPAQQQIRELTETQYRREFLDPLRQQFEHLVRGIGEHIDLGEGVDPKQQWVEPMLRDYGIDSEQFKLVTPEYIESRIRGMRGSNIQREKMRGYARDFFAATQRREQADQTGWKENTRRAYEDQEIDTQKVVNTINKVVREPEFKQLLHLNNLADVGDPWAQEEIKRLNAYWVPRAQAYRQQGNSQTDAIRQSWRDLLKSHKIKLSSVAEPEAAAPKKTTSEPEKAKANPTHSGSMEERLKKKLQSNFDAHLAKEPAPVRGGYYK